MQIMLTSPRPTEEILTSQRLFIALSPPSHHGACCDPQILLRFFDFYFGILALFARRQSDAERCTIRVMLRRSAISGTKGACGKLRSASPLDPCCALTGTCVLDPSSSRPAPRSEQRKHNTFV